MGNNKQIDTQSELQSQDKCYRGEEGNRTIKNKDLFMVVVCCIWGGGISNYSTIKFFFFNTNKKNSKNNFTRKKKKVQIEWPRQVFVLGIKKKTKYNTDILVRMNT